MTTIELAHPSTDPVAVPVRWDRRKGAILLGVPAAWAVLLFLHPTGDGNLVYPVISGQLGRWQAVHVGMAIFIPLFAYVVWTLTTGVENVAARTARVLLPVGAVVYGLFEGMLGIGAGVLVGHVQDLAGRDQPVGAALVEDFFMRSPIFRLFEYGGTLALGGGIIAAAIALRHSGPSAARPSVCSSCRRRSSPRTFHPSARSAWRASSRRRPEWPLAPHDVLSLRSPWPRPLCHQRGCAEATQSRCPLPAIRRLGGHDECKQSSPRTDTLPAAEE